MITGTWIRALIGPEQAAELLAELETATWVDGRASAHGAAQAAKRNLQLAATDPMATRLSSRLLAAATANDAFRAHAQPHTMLPFTFSRYDEGMSYGDHLDLPMMGTGAGPVRTDLSMTLFLSDPSSYDGGELAVPGAEGPWLVKGAPGDAFVYPSGTIHRVEPVTRGRRIVALTWIRSLIADGEARAIVTSLAEVATSLSRLGNAADAMRVRAVMHQLVRRWSG